MFCLAAPQGSFVWVGGACALSSLCPSVGSDTCQSVGSHEQSLVRLWALTTIGWGGGEYFSFSFRRMKTIRNLWDTGIKVLSICFNVKTFTFVTYITSSLLIDASYSDIIQFDKTCSERPALPQLYDSVIYNKMNI